MENKLDIRVGDVVLVKLRVALAANGSFPAVQALQGGNILTIDPCDIESIISRAETPQETIARLEAELAKSTHRIKWEGGKCPVAPSEDVFVWLRNGQRVIRLAIGCDWAHNNNGGDIIAYMVLPQ